MYEPQFILIGVFFLAWLVTLGIREKVLEMIRHSGFVRPNYQGENIPLAAGIIFFPAALIVALPLYLLEAPELRELLPLLMFVAAGGALLGLLDDFWGSREASGLGGHFKALLRGRLTTGAVKALGGGLVALWAGVVLYPGQWGYIADSTLIIALSANLINLFDLRPGRAGKIYILLYIILLPAFWDSAAGIFATLFLGSLVAFLPADLKARAMMGDVGSNVLGLVMGFTAAACLEGYQRVVFLLFLILIHLLTERFSLTKIIAGNPVLNYLDQWGRKNNKKVATDEE